MSMSWPSMKPRKVLKKFGFQFEWNRIDSMTTMKLKSLKWIGKSRSPAPSVGLDREMILKSASQAIDAAVRVP